MEKRYLIYPNQWSKDLPAYFTETQLVAMVMTGVLSGRDFNANIKKIRKELNKEVRNKLKQGIPCFVVAVRVKGRLCIENVIYYNQIIIVDFDLQDNSQFAKEGALEELKQLLRNDPYIRIGFISTSGHGLKIIVAVSSWLEHHRIAFDQLCTYFKNTYKIVADPSGSDAVRNCCISFDETPIVNYEADVFPVNTEVEVAIKEDHNSSDRSNKPAGAEEPYELTVVRELLLVIEPGKIDITKDRVYWRNIAFFLARYGKEALDLFLRISQFYPKYDAKECKELFAYALKNKKDKIGLGTVLKACKENGIDISKYSSAYYASKEGGDEKTNEIEFVTPTLPEEIFDRIPVHIRNKLEKHMGHPRKRDAALLSSLVCYSCILPNVKISHGGNRYSTHLYFVLGSPSGSNKSVILGPVEDIKSVNNQILQQSQNAIADYYARKEAGEDMKDEKPPVLVRLIYGADISLSGILKKMVASNNGILLVAPELDAFNKNKGESWGASDVLLRAAFQNEDYITVRNEYEIHLEEPKIGNIFSGTHDQIRAFMPDCENGLSNRYIIYIHSDDDDWNDQMFEDNCDMEAELFDQTSEKNLRLFNHLNSSPESIFVWSNKEHLKILNANYRAWFNDSKKAFGAETGVIIKRLGIIITRIACVLTVLRKFEEFDGNAELSSSLLSKKFTCNDTDFHTALTIVKVLRQHSLHLFENLHSKKKAKITAENSRLMQFFEFLPEKFNRKDILDVAISTFSVKERAIGYYFTGLVNKGLLKRGEAEGSYFKVNHTSK